MRVSITLLHVLRGGVLLLLLSARRATAEPSAYELTYTAAPDCPAREEFQTLVRRQLAESHELSAAAAPMVAVQIEAVPGGYRGRFELQREQGTSVRRELNASSCSEVAPALAFVLALALGKRESDEGQSLPGSRPGAKPQPRALSSVGNEHPSAPRSPPAPQTMNWEFGAGAEFGPRWGLGPTWTFVEAGSLEAMERVRHGFFRWDVRASLSRSETISRIDSFGVTEFSWLAGGVEVCPLQLPLHAGLSALPCLGAHVGEIRAKGRPAAKPGAMGRDTHDLWLDGFANLRLELQVLKALLLQAEAQLLVPATGYRFAFDSPDTTVYQVPAVSGAAFLGVAVHFP